jgi:hypothetical protein
VAEFWRPLSGSEGGEGERSYIPKQFIRRPADPSPGSLLSPPSPQGRGLEDGGWVRVRQPSDPTRVDYGNGLDVPPQRELHSSQNGKCAPGWMYASPGWLRLRHEELGWGHGLSLSSFRPSPLGRGWRE